MKASQHPAYEAAVQGYAFKVAGPEAPRTLDNERRLGILIGVCMALGLDAWSEVVKGDIEIERAKIWTRVR